MSEFSLIKVVGNDVSRSIKESLRDRLTTSKDVIDACWIMFMFEEDPMFHVFVDRDMAQMAHDRLLLVRDDAEWIAKDEDNLDIVNDWIEVIGMWLDGWEEE